MQRALACTVALVLAVGAGNAFAEPLPEQLLRAQRVSSDKLWTQRSIGAGQYPFYTDRTGSWYMLGTRRWVAGFLPGSLWYEYQRTGGQGWRDAAVRLQAPIAAYRSDAGQPDLGFMFAPTFVTGYRLTGDERWRRTALEAAASFASRYEPRAGVVRFWNTTPGVYVSTDAMMNLELLFWATRSGGGRHMREIATNHALRTARDFIRADGSSYHYVAYDESSGRVLEKGTGQGAFDESTWARGHAWLIYGMSVAYRETGDPRFLDAARRASDYWFHSVPSDLVPYWDFDAPGIPAQPRDSSAAAVAASAFVELGRLDPDAVSRERYLAYARSTLLSLSSAEYLSEDSSFAAVLQHGTYFYDKGLYDQGTSWGDYYFSEALMRLRTQVVRLAGTDRYGTAIRVSRTGFAAAEVVVVASGESFPDALAASGLAGVHEAPLLLTRHAAIPAGLASEIARLGASRVVVVGGPRTVNDDVLRALERLPGVSAERIGGRDRYHTAALVAARVRVEDGGVAPARVFVARGDSFADALAVSPLAYATRSPVLLTRPRVLPGETASALRALGASHVVVAGSTSAVSASVAEALDRLGGVTVERLGGADRYETAARIARWGSDRGLASAGLIAVTTGLDYPDALAGGALAGSRGGMLLLTAPRRLSAPVAGFLSANATETTEACVLGGEQTLSGVAEQGLRRALEEGWASR